VVGGTGSTNGENNNAYKILVQNTQGEKPLGRMYIDWRIILELILEKL